MAPEPARHGKHIEFLLYQHEETKSALLLSRDGCRRNAEWIPRSLVLIPTTTQLIRVEGEPSERGVFCIESWKTKEIGWVEVEDPAQMRLV